MHHFMKKLITFHSLIQNYPISAIYAPKFTSIYSNILKLYG